MSVAYDGNYEASMFDARKRYRMHFQKGVPLTSNELEEIQDVSDSFVKQLITANFPTGSSINDGFKVVESSIDNTNNFTITGGDGTVNGAGVIFVDGYILFLKSDIEYNQQNNSGNITDDDYTRTNIPELNQPGTPRTDEVYIDFYFAEASATGTGIGTYPPEYLDTSLQSPGIGFATANRLRMVQDIRVAEGTLIPTDGNDSNGIYHRFVKIATIVRDTSDTILNSMITDERILVNSVSSYSTGNTITDLLLADGSNIGDDLHRINTIYMASNIDVKSSVQNKEGLTLISHTGIGTTLEVLDRVRFSTDGMVGFGTMEPQDGVHVSGNDIRVDNTDPKINFYDDATNFGYVQGNSSLLGLDVSALGEYDIRFLTNGVQRAVIDASGNVGIGTGEALSLFHVNGNCRIEDDLTIVGSSNFTSMGVEGKLTITQSANDNCLVVNQTGANSATVVNIQNSGTGYALTTNNGNVGLGSVLPIAPLDVLGSWPVGQSTVRAQSLSSGNDISGFGCYDYLGARKAYMNFDSSVGAKIVSESGVELYINSGANLNINSDVIISNDVSIGGVSPIVNPAAFNNIRLNVGTIMGHDTAGLYLSANSYYNESAAWTPITEGPASYIYATSDGVISFLSAPSHASLHTQTENVRIALNGDVGIGTNNPLTKFHVVGTGTFTGGVGIGTDLLVAGSIGIGGAVSSTYRSYVYGDSYVSQDIYSGRDAKVGRHLEVAGNGYVSGNVGLGITNPSYKFHVIGSGYVSTTFETGGNLTSNGDCFVAGNMGIGTLLPLAKSHVQGNSRVTGNLLVTDTITTSTGSVIVALSCLLNSNIASNSYVMSKFGVGTMVPMYQLEVEGNSYISTDLTVGRDSTVTRNCVISGNVGIGTSDITKKLTVKTNVNNGFIFDYDGVYNNDILSTYGPGLYLSPDYNEIQPYTSYIGISPEMGYVDLVAGGGCSLYLDAGSVRTTINGETYLNTDINNGFLFTFEDEEYYDVIETYGSGIWFHPDANYTQPYTCSLSISGSGYGNISVGNCSIVLSALEQKVAIEGHLEIEHAFGNFGIHFNEDYYNVISCGTDVTGTDNYGSIYLCGGRYQNSAYGSFIHVNGNDVNGDLRLYAGDAGNILMFGETVFFGDMNFISYTDEYSFNFSSLKNYLTVDRFSDDSEINICHGLDFSGFPSRVNGAFISLYGSDHDTEAGILNLASGSAGAMNLTAYDMTLSSNAEMRFNSNGYPFNFKNGGTTLVTIDPNGAFFTNMSDFRVTVTGAVVIQGSYGVSLPGLFGDTGGSDLRYDIGSGDVFYETSSIRYKENVDYSSVDTSWLHELKVCKFDRKDKKRIGEIGLIAEDIEKIAPDLVVYKKIDEKKVPETYNKSDLVPILINEVQILKQQINFLIEEINSIKTKL